MGKKPQWQQREEAVSSYAVWEAYVFPTGAVDYIVGDICKAGLPARKFPDKMSYVCMTVYSGAFCICYAAILGS